MGVRAATSAVETTDRRQSSPTPRSSGRALTCRTGADGPVRLVFPEQLQGKGPGVARTVRVQDLKLDGRRLLTAETDCPLLDQRSVVVLV